MTEGRPGGRSLSVQMPARKTRNAGQVKPAAGNQPDPDPHNNSYRTQVINGFLEALDSLKYVEGVMIVATTNYPDKIDAAVLRPGRIDVRAQVPLPRS